MLRRPDTPGPEYWLVPESGADDHAARHRDVVVELFVPQVVAHVVHAQEGLEPLPQFLSHADRELRHRGILDPVGPLGPPVGLTAVVAVQGDDVGVGPMPEERHAYRRGGAWERRIADRCPG